MPTRQRLIALNACPTLDRATICRLGHELAAWSDLADRTTGSEACAPRAADLGVRAHHLARAVRAVADADRVATTEIAKTADRGGEIVVLGDDAYPPALLDLALPPPVLYVRGTIPAGLALAMVGSRTMSAYGREAASLFATELAAAGLVIASGFARGVDATAHRAACANGRTVAVLGCGLDVDYPRGQRDLAAEIARSGALITEFPLGVEPRPWHFPVRNRVIAGLSIGTLVVQAAIRSGSLITAHHSLELGREVYAIPGSIFDRLGKGPNRLIADGAAAVLEPRDVLETLSLHQQRSLYPALRERTAPKVRGFAGTLLEAIRPGESMTCEEIASALDAPVDNVLSALLELGGHLRREPGPRYRR